MVHIEHLSQNKSRKTNKLSFSSIVSDSILRVSPQPTSIAYEGWDAIASIIKAEKTLADRIWVKLIVNYLNIIQIEHSKSKRRRHICLFQLNSRPERSVVLTGIIDIDVSNEFIFYVS